MCLQRDSVNLEQVTTHCDCFKKVSNQFLLADTNWESGTLDKSLFILELGADYSTVSPTYSCIFFLFSVTGIINRLSWNNVSFNLCSLAQV